MTLEEIIQLRDVKQKELSELIKAIAVVSCSYGELDIEIAKLDLKKKELRQALIKSKSKKACLEIEIEQLKNAYFNAKAQ